MSKPWGVVGAWALEAELAEAEEKQLASSQSSDQSFPSLKEAAAANPKKKKKPVAIPLTQFVSSTSDDLTRLPTAPRERGPDELEFSRRGFSSYGGGGGGGPRRGGFDDEPRRGLPRGSDVDLPSRADEVDNWAAGKRQSLPMDRGARGPDRYGSLGGSSRADEVDNWAAGKKSVLSFGSGFRSSLGGSSDSNRWGGGGGRDGLGESNGERRRLVLDPLKKAGIEGTGSADSQTRASVFGAARPREEVLTGKGLDWRKIDSEIEVKKMSRPTSSHSSRPSSAQSSRPGSPLVVEGVKARPRVNPFGDAKPREVILQEKGKDWRKIELELEHRMVDRYRLY